MQQLRPALFYDVRNKAIHGELVKMLMSDPPHVLQSEGAMHRLHDELKDAIDAVGKYVMWSTPGHLAFSDPRFRQTLRSDCERWEADLLIIDNWSDCVTDDKFTDYQQGLDNIRAALPAGDRTPAVMILAHLSKAVVKSDKQLSGRSLMAHVSGSFRIGQKARTVFTLVRAHPEITDDDLVIFGCATANNGTPLEDAAYHRQPLSFTLEKDFDLDAWRNPDQEDENKVVSEDVMRNQVVPEGRRASRKVLVGEIMGLGYSQATAYRALMLKGKFGEFLVEEGGLLRWRG